MQLESRWFIVFFPIIFILYFTLYVFKLCSYTSKFDKVELNKIVVSVSDLPEPEVILNNPASTYLTYYAFTLGK